MSVTLTAIGSSLAGYLHQDMDIEFEDPAEALEAFLDAAPIETAMAVLAEVAMLLAADLDDAELSRLLFDAGIYFFGSNDVRGWLMSVERQLGRRLWERRFEASQ